MTDALIELKFLRCNAKNLKEKILVAGADVAVLFSLRKELLVQVDAKLINLKKMQSQQKLRAEELIKLYVQQMKTSAKFAQLRMQNAKITAKTTKLKPVEIGSKRPAKRAKVARDSGERRECTID